MSSKIEEKLFTSSVLLLQRNPQANVETIIAHAGISRRSFYKYFSSREDFISQLIIYVLKKIDEQVLSPSSSMKELLELGIQYGHYYVFLSYFLSYFFDQKIYHIYLNQQKIIKDIIKQDPAYSRKFTLDWMMNYIESLIIFSHNMIHLYGSKKSKVIAESLVSLELLNTSEAYE